MAMADNNHNSLPIALYCTSATPHEITLAKKTITKCIISKRYPRNLIGDRAYDSDRLDKELFEEYGINMIAPHKSNRKRPKTQDGRMLRRYKNRWKIERLFAWLKNYRRVAVRYEYHFENFIGFVQLACILIMLRRCL
jgi:transposase